MSVQPKATLKSYFETGDKPTQANFEDLIDSLLDQSDGIKNGGNSFGADASVGTNDNFNLIIRTNNATRWTVREDGRIQKVGTTSALTHDIATGTIGATGYSGTLITFGNNLTLNANSKIVVVDDLVPNSAGTANLGTSSLQFGVVYSHNLLGRTYTGTNTAGIDLLIGSSIGTGNSTPTSITFQTPTVGSTGSTAQTLATRLTLNSTAATFATDILFSGGSRSISNSSGGMIIETSSAGNDVKIRALGDTNAATVLTVQATSARAAGSGISRNIRSLGDFTVSSGSGEYNNIEIAGTIDQSGTATGAIRGIYYNPTITNVVGSHYAFEATSGQMVMPSGSSTSPTYTFGSHTNAGIFYSSGENAIGFAYGGTRVMTVNNAILYMYGQITSTDSAQFGNFLFLNCNAGSGVGGTMSVVSQWSGANGYVLKANASDYSGNPFVYNNSSGTTLFKVNSAGDIITNSTTASSSTSTGALVVSGGVGIAGDVYLGGNLANTSTGYLQVAVGTTAQEPTASNGMLRYDSTTNKLRAVENGSWVDVISTGLSSPLTTKGDLWGYSTGDTRIAVGTDGYLLVADSTQAAGVAWKMPKFYYADESGTSTSAYWLNTAGNTGWMYGGGGLYLKRFGTSVISVESSYMTVLNTVVNSSYNFAIGAISWGTSAQSVMAHKNGVAPSTNVTDCYQLYAADIVAGNSAPHFQTENGDVIKLYKQTALTSADSSSLNSGDATTDTVIANMRTRINELETMLQNLGLL